MQMSSEFSDVEEFSWRLHIHTNSASLVFLLSVWFFHRGHRHHIGQVSSVAGQAPTFDDVHFSRVGPHAVWSMSWNVVTSTLRLDGPHRAPTKFPVRYQPVQITFISYSAIDVLPEPELFSGLVFCAVSWSSVAVLCRRIDRVVSTPSLSPRGSHSLRTFQGKVRGSISLLSRVASCHLG